MLIDNWKLVLFGVGGVFRVLVVIWWFCLWMVLIMLVVVRLCEVILFGFS